MKFKKITLSIAFVFAAHVTQIPLSYASDETINLHNLSSAEQEYENFKAGSAVDPLESIRTGYNDDYDNYITNSVSESKLSIISEMISTENQRVSDFKSNLMSDKYSSKMDIYKNAINDDGDFDYEAYAAEYVDYLSNNNSATNEALYDIDSFAIDVLESSNDYLLEAGSSYADNAYSASENIISIINANNASYIQTIQEKLDSAIEETETRIPVSEEAVVLAYEFDGECGDSCVFPEIPDAEEPEDSCKHDSSNYISISDLEETGSGDEEIHDYVERYVYGGTTVYKYSWTKNARDGVDSATKFGSKSEYSKDTSYTSEEVSDGYIYTEYGICKD
jgi:hypothetical protein